MSELLKVSNLSVKFPKLGKGFWAKPSGYVSAVDDVSFTIKQGETLGLVGESGSGKTTLGLSILLGRAANLGARSSFASATRTLI